MNTTQENVNMGQERVDLSDNLAGKNREQNTVELLYTWIEMDETGFIEKQGFNFSPKYHFEMKSRGEGSYELICTEKAQCPNVWQHESIVNLTAIIGKNGAGKSSLLLCLADAAKYYEERSNSVRMLQIYRNKNDIEVIHNLVQDVSVFGQQKCGIVNIAAKQLANAENLLNKRTVIHITNAFPAQGPGSKGVIHFSPGANSVRSRDFYRKASGLEQPKNLPEDFRSLPEDFRSLQEKIISYMKEKDFSKLATVSYYALAGEEQLPDVNNRKIILGVSNPARWFVYPEQLDQDRCDENAGMTSYALMKKYLELPRQGYSGQDDIIGVLREALWLEVLSLPNIVKKGFEDSTIRNIREEDPCAYLEPHESESDAYAPVVTYYQQAVMEINKLERILKNGVQEHTGGGPYHVFMSAAPPVAIERSTETYQKFCKFVDEQMKAPVSFVLKHLMIGLPSQSSGERALQNVFSWLRLPPYFDKLFSEEFITIQDNVLVLLDEVDLYMHPEWQRLFLKQLSDGLNKEYKDKCIQVILTTHSPLVLSDIPAGNVIYLEEHGGRCAVVDGPAETFGADIFTLLRDSFFLKKSIGAFAHERICEIIDKMNQLKKSPEDEKLWAICEGYGPIIDMIGEPIIRRKLRQMYADIFSAKSEDLHDRYLKKLTQMLESSDMEERKRGQEMLHKMFAEQDSN